MGNESKQCLDEDAAAAVAAAAAVSGATGGFKREVRVRVFKPPWVLLAQWAQLDYSIVNMINAIPKPNPHTIY